MLTELLKKIPVHIIINNIIPYTCNIQPGLLLNDIKSYYFIKKFIYRKYIDSKIINENILLSNINFICNNVEPIMFGVTDMFVNKYRRLLTLKHHRTLFIKKLILFPDCKPNTSIKVLLCLLSPEERTILLQCLHYII